MPRIEIDNAAADGELPPRSDLSDTLVTAAHELFNQTFHVRVFSAPKTGDSGFKRAAFRSGLIETCSRCDDDARTGPALDLHEQRQPFGCNFRVGQHIFDGCKLGFRQKQRIRLPIQQTFVNQFLRMNVGTEDPNRGVGRPPIISSRFTPGVRNGGGQKCLRRLDHVRKLDGPLSSLYCSPFPRDWFARRDTLQEPCADRFFHRKT